MSGWFKTGTFTTPASGTTVISVTSRGTNPKAIHLFCTNNTSDDANQIHAAMNHGFSDGSVDCSVLHNTDQTSTTNTRRSNSNTLALDVELPTDDSALFTITAVAMNVNDVTLTYGSFTVGHIVNYVIFGGTDCQAFVGTVNSNDASSPFTGVGFQPEFVIAICTGNAANNQSQHSYLSFGVSDGTSEWCLMGYQGQNLTTPKGSVLIENEIVGQHDLEFADWGATILAMNSDGFTYENVPTADTGGSDVWYVLCISFGGTLGIDIGTFTKSTATAPVTQQMPDVGFTPQGYFLASACDVGTTQTNQNNCRMSYGAYDGDDGQSCIETAQDADNTDAHSRSHSSEVLQITQDLDTNGVQASATPDAITDSTPSFEWNPNTTAATIIGYYAVQEESVTITLSAEAGSYSLTGVVADLEYHSAVIAGVGSYTLNGVDALLEYHQILTLDIGSYSLVGVAADLNVVTPIFNQTAFRFRADEAL